MNLSPWVAPAELAGHCYFEAQHWESAHRLALRVFGHTDENPSHCFCYYLSVDLASGTALRLSGIRPGPIGPDLVIAPVLRVQIKSRLR